MYYTGRKAMANRNKINNELLGFGVVLFPSVRSRLLFMEVKKYLLRSALCVKC